MSQKDHPEFLETISSLVDGECSELELRRLLRDQNDQTVEGEPGELEITEPQLRRNWAEFQQIGSAMRGEPSEGSDISSAVMAAIQAEAQPKANESGFRKLVKPISQFAVAASVAAVSILGIQQYQLAQTDIGSSAEIAGSETATEVSAPDTLFTPPQGFEYSPQTSVVSTNPSEPSFKNEVRILIPAESTLVEAEDSLTEPNAILDLEQEADLP